MGAFQERDSIVKMRIMYLILLLERAVNYCIIIYEAAIANKY